VLGVRGASRPTVGSVPAPDARRPLVVALALDVLAVVVFVTVGRRSHEQAAGVVGVLGTALPFCLGGAAGWVAARGWQRPLAMVPTGVAAWVGAIVVGMPLRNLVFGDGTASSFVIVATLFLGATLVGWRLVAAAVSRRRVPA
jgi:hypothetical protein